MFTIVNKSPSGTLSLPRFLSIFHIPSSSLLPPCFFLSYEKWVIPICGRKQNFEQKRVQSPGIFREKKIQHSYKWVHRWGARKTSYRKVRMYCGEALFIPESCEYIELLDEWLVVSRVQVVTKKLIDVCETFPTQGGCFDVWKRMNFIVYLPSQ